MTIYGPHCSHDDCSFTICDETGFVEWCCATPDCKYCGGLRNEPEDWGSDPERFAAMPPAVQERVRAYWERYPLVRRAPHDDVTRLDTLDWEP